MIYFDNAATTMKKPEAVVQAVVEAMQSFGNSGRGVHEASLEASRSIFFTRKLLADFFHAPSPECIAFTMNSTESLNIAIQGLLNPGDHVITTALEHNSVLRPLYMMQERGVQLTIIPADEEGCINYQDFTDAICPETRAIVCTHGSNLTGNVIDIKKIGEICKAHGLIFIVDASQTAGIFPINVEEMQIDVLCFTGHKSLLGPQGTGGLYVNPKIQIRPLLSGGSGVQTYLKTHPHEMPTALEAGTLNAHGLAGLHAAIEYLQETGLDCIHNKEMDLMWKFYKGIKDIEGVRIYGDFSEKERCPIVTINIRDYDSSLVSDTLYEEYEIATRPGAHCAPLMHEALGTVAQGAVRFSFSLFNTEEEIDIAIKAVREIAELD